jgi:PAS domain S-box-containing protein
VGTAFDGVNICEYDPVTRGSRLIFCNDRFVEMSGYTREQLERAQDLRPFRQAHLTPEQFNEKHECLVSGRPYRGTASWLRPDGKENAFEFSSVAIKVGDKYHVLGFDRDITDRLRAERALRESEERYRTLVENLNVGVFRISMTPEGRRGECNRALASMFGCESVEEIMRWAGSCRELMDDVNRLVEAIGNQRSIKDHERTEPTKDGRRIVISVTANAQYDESGSVRWVAGIVEDVTERKRAEEALRRSEEKYRLLVENAGVPILVFTYDGVLTTMNLMAAAYFGGKPEHFTGKTMWDLFPKDIADVQMAQVRQAIESGEALIADGVSTVAGDRKWYSARLQPLREGQGTAPTVQMIIHDITERVRAEEELISYQGQLQSLAADLLATEERERQRIASDLHDNIGQALAMAAMKAGALKRFASSPKLSEGLDEVVALVQQALEGSRTLTAELGPPILRQLGFEAALQWLAEDAEERCGLTVDFETNDEHGPLNDETSALLFRAVRELLVNVAKHAQAKGARLSVSSDEDEVEVTVQDDGVGFEPSPTGSDPSRKGGFGLFSIREQLRQVGGRLEVASQPGRGTVVRLIVPAESQSPRPHGAAW